MQFKLLIHILWIWFLFTGLVSDNEMSAPSSEESVSLLEEYQHYSEVQYESVSNFDKGLRNKEQVLQLHYALY